MSKDMSLKKKVAKELEAIKHKHGGLLRPADVVEFARDAHTGLHQKFDWSDRSAAAKFRLQQAREVIRCHVTIIHEDAEPVRAYFSLLPDRKAEGGGYRGIQEVIDNKTWRAQMLETAMSEMRSFRAKYSALKELVNVFEEMEAVERKHKDRVARPDRYRATVSGESVSAHA